MKNIVICLVSALSIILFPFNSYASESGTVIDLNEYYGMTIEEIYMELDETGAFISPVPSTFDTGNYNVDENISLSSGGISCTYVNQNGTYSTTLPFGYSLAVYNVAQSITCTLFNNGNPLFSQGGTLYLNVSSYARNILMKVTYTDGSGYQEQFGGNWSDGSSYIEIVVNNDSANIAKIQLISSGSIQQSNGDYALRGGIFKYGYILNDTTGSGGSQISSDILSALNNFFSPYWTNFYNYVVSALEDSEIVVILSDVYTRLENIYYQLIYDTSAFWNLIRSNITEYLTTINTSIQDYIAIFKDRMSLLYSQFTVSTSAFWNNFDTKLSDVLDRYWSDDDISPETVKDSLTNFSDNESMVYESGMEYIENYDFEENDISNLSNDVFGAMGFVSGLLENIYTSSGDYSAIINTTLNMLLLVIVLGIARFWRY